MSSRTTILIPCYNEAEGIPQLCSRLRLLLAQLSPDAGTDILFVDDGSTDGTSDVINQEAVGLPYRLVRHDQNRGLGAALRTGFAESSTDEVVTLDSDCTYDPLQIPDLLAELRSGADVVTGSPYHPEGTVVEASAWRLFLSRSLSGMYRIVLPRKLHTYTSCFRAYRRQALLQLKVEDAGFLAVTQLLISAILQGLRVAEVPSRLESRRFGRSKIRFVSVSMAHLGYFFQLLRLRLLRRRTARAHSIATFQHSSGTNKAQQDIHHEFSAVTK